MCARRLLAQNLEPIAKLRCGSWLETRTVKSDRALPACEAVVNGVRVHVMPRNISCVVVAPGNGAFAGPAACTRDFERGNGAIRRTHKAVVHAAGIRRTDVRLFLFIRKDLSV